MQDEDYERKKIIGGNLYTRKYNNKGGAMNKYTSFELSKKLNDNGCELKGSVNCDNLNTLSYVYSGEYETSQSFDVFWDICVKYSENFFGVNFITQSKIIYFIVDYLRMDTDIEIIEDFIWDNCIYNPKNKEI